MLNILNKISSGYLIPPDFSMADLVPMNFYINNLLKLPRSKKIIELYAQTERDNLWNSEVENKYPALKDYSTNIDDIIVEDMKDIKWANLLVSIKPLIKHLYMSHSGQPLNVMDDEIYKSLKNISNSCKEYIAIRKKFQYDVVVQTCTLSSNWQKSKDYGKKITQIVFYKEEDIGKHIEKLRNIHLGIVNSIKTILKYTSHTQMPKKALDNLKKAMHKPEQINAVYDATKEYLLAAYKSECRL